MDQIYNELSISCCFSNVHEANDGMLESVKVSRELNRLGFSRTVRTTQDFFTRNLCTGHSVHSWVTDKTSINKEERLYFLSVASKGPYLEAIFDFIQEEQSFVFEAKWNEVQAIGLGVAYLRDIPALSLSGNDNFNDDPVEVSIIKIKDEDEENGAVEVCNLSEIQQVENRKQWIRERLQRSVFNGIEAWERKEELFSNLRWCGDTENQLTGLSGNEYYFYNIIRHLSLIDLAIKEWASGEFKLTGVTYSGESKTTMRKYGKLREFNCPDGTKRIFELHTKIMGANIRIHFFPELAENVIYIGYIGEHLPYQ